VTVSLRPGSNSVACLTLLLLVSARHVVSDITLQGTLGQEGHLDVAAEQLL
jgi:hypothetical protein